MRGSVVVCIATLALGCSACGAGSPPEPRVDPRPHLLVISLDTLRRDALPAFEPTAQPLPALDRFAASSVRLTRALSTASWTLPAHASLMTGLYPDRAGGTDARIGLADGVRSVASILRDRGYETLAFTDGGYLHRRYGFSLGFQRYDEWEHPVWGLAATGLPRQGRRAEQPGSFLFDRELAYLAQRSADDRPFFLFSHTYAVHEYYRESRETSELGAAARANLECLGGRRRCDAQTWDRLRAQYRAAVERVDAGLGRLLERLAATGLDASTIVVVLSDHGEGFDVGAGVLHHGGRLHPDLVRIPLLVRLPGVEPRDLALPVSLVDLMPTLLELAGAPAPEGLDGRSVARLLLRADAQRLAPAPRVAMEHFYSWEDGVRQSTPAVRDRPLAVAVAHEDLLLETQARAPGTGSVYALVPGVVPSAAARAELERAAAARLQPASASSGTPRVERDAELLQQLEQLGYVE